MRQPSNPFFWKVTGQANPRGRTELPLLQHEQATSLQPHTTGIVPSALLPHPSTQTMATARKSIKLFHLYYKKKTIAKKFTLTRITAEQNKDKTVVFEYLGFFFFWHQTPFRRQSCLPLGQPQRLLSSHACTRTAAETTQPLLKQQLNC